MKRQKLYISSVHDVSNGRACLAPLGVRGCGFISLTMGVVIYFLRTETALSLLSLLIEMSGR